MSKKISQDIIKQTFVDDVRGIINAARQTAVRSVDFCRVQMYWNIGRRIFEEEQQGKERAEYGTYLIKNLASRLEPEYGILQPDNWNEVANFTGFFQLRPHCVRN